MDNTYMNANEFAKTLDVTDRRTMLLLSRYIFNRKETDYKIKDGNLTIDIIDSSAVRIRAVFTNVLIEDGRRPKKVLFNEPSFEEIKKGYRMRFVNGLNASGAQSSFTFRRFISDIKMYDYSLQDGTFAPGADKLVWRTVMEKLRPLIEKRSLLGEELLNESEKENMSFLLFLYVYLGLYLRDDTVMGDDPHSIRYNKMNVMDYELTDEMIGELKAILAVTDVTDGLTECLDDYKHKKSGFFPEWCMFLESINAKRFYEYVLEIIRKCAAVYPVRTDEAEQLYERIRETCDETAKDMGWG
ncbi:MAG: hypothetical protein IJL97_01935, partial [Lachnospiraceae bacterium]|nr:hypothetical protein [Lachnospiraceae bacterium]